LQIPGNARRAVPTARRALVWDWAPRAPCGSNPFNLFVVLCATRVTYGASPMICATSCATRRRSPLMPPRWLPDQARVGRGFCPTSPTQGECVQLISLGGLWRFEFTIHVPLSRSFLSLPMLGCGSGARGLPCRSNPFNLFVVPCGLSPVAPDPQPGLVFFVFSP
jgi:hypothetical protein